MKIILFTVCVLAMAMYAQGRHRNSFWNCLSEYELNKAEFRWLLAKKDPKAGCVIACTMEKKEEMINGVIDEKGILENMQYLVKKYGRGKISTIVNTCKTEVDDLTDKCERALAMRSCKQRELWRLHVHSRHQRRQFFKECLHQNNLTKDEFLELKKSGSPQVGCITACVMEKKGEIKDGEIDKERMVENMSPEVIMRIGKNKLSKLINVCAVEVDDVTDKCEKSLAMKNCKKRELWKVHADGRRERRQYMKQCLKRHNLSKEEYDELKKNEDSKAGNVMVCLMQKNGELHNGKINKRKIVENMPENVIMIFGTDTLHEVVENCANKVEDINDKVEIAMAMKKCLRKFKHQGA